MAGWPSAFRALAALAELQSEDFAGEAKGTRSETSRLGRQTCASGQSSVSRTQLMMMRAGYRSADAMLDHSRLKMLLPIALLALFCFSGVYRYSPIFIVGAAAVLGFLLPEMWISAAQCAPAAAPAPALPDALDLLVICVEVGLGLDQAFLRVAQELRVAFIPN